VVEEVVMTEQEVGVLVVIENLQVLLQDVIQVSPLGACVAALPVTATTYPITVGGGGAGLSAGPS
jgi:hypothetical protein